MATKLDDGQLIQLSQQLESIASILEADEQGKEITYDD